MSLTEWKRDKEEATETNGRPQFYDADDTSDYATSRKLCSYLNVISLHSRDCHMDAGLYELTY